MATNGKPTTRFTITYGDLPVESFGGTLTPVIVAPRYVVHKWAAGYAESDMGAYDINDVKATNSYEFPDFRGGKIDADSCKLLARDAMIVVSEDSGTAITGTLNADLPSCIKTSGTVRVVGSGDTATKPEGLSGYSIAAGDMVKIGSGSVYKVGTVVDVLPSYTTPEPEISAVSDNAGTADITSAKFTANAVKSNVSYLLNVVGAGASGGKRIEVRAIAGDLGYYSVIDFTAGVAAVIGTGKHTLELSDEQLKAMIDGDGFVLKIFADKVEAYDQVFVDVDLSDLITDKPVDLEFYKKVQGGDIIINTGYWDIVADDIKVQKNIFISVGGTQFRLASAQFGLEYRELITENANSLVSTSGQYASDFAGVFDPLNPMGFAYTVFNAVASGLGGGTAYMVAVDEDSDAGYRRAIERAGRYEAAYAFTPIRNTDAVKAFVKDTIAKYSRPEVAQFKCGWLVSGVQQESLVLDVDDSGVAIIGSINNNTLTLMSGNLISSGVLAGDIVKVLGGVDGDTVATTRTFKIGRVTSTTTAELEDADGISIGAGCVAIHRKLSASQYAEAVAAEAANINNHRIKLIIADQVNYGGFTDVDRAYLAVACAAMRAALPPHAPLTDRTIDGFTLTERVGWTDADFEIMNNGGAWIVYNDIDGAVKNYHQITTLTNGTVAEEDSVVSNGDAIVRELRSAIRPLASGSSNASLALLGTIEAKVHAVMASIAARSYSAELGPQFEDYAILGIYRPDGNRQRIIGKFSITGQLPLQDGEFGFNLI